MIEVKDLTKKYGNFTAVRDVSFEVEKGEILGFLGPNAAGKTTTMRVLTCFMPATAGTARVAGFDTFSQSLDVRRRVGYLPENVPLYLDMRVRPYLEFIAKIKDIPSRDRKKAVNRVIELAALEEVEHRIVGHCSKGYRQRVGLAQALIHDPDVLILDEPTNGLDPKQINEVREVIKGLAGDHTIILSSHILPEVSKTCERVVIIDQGRIVAGDTPANLDAQLRGSQSISAQIRGPVSEVMDLLKEKDGVVDVKTRSSLGDGLWQYEIDVVPGRDLRSEVATSVVGSNWDLVELTTAGMSLEEIFLELTTQEEEGD
ncbi:MAG: ATP-binding cassette domain-containing protein [Gemmatimonadetes bacterium]|nr:ATP-binding cassette domain-containing protein [Gemmatimonadota bacterium]MYG15947.1 ATP-binding cassette domain-containing protein [Gemmatimonadota bacterium]